jgi:hypothetical protein
MSEKTRKKKDGEDKNKNNQRMREANEDSGEARNGIDTHESQKSGGKSKE